MASRVADQDCKETGQGRAAKAAVSFRRDTRGATAVEYGLIAALMAATIITGLSQLGGSNSGSWGATADKVGKAIDPTPP